MSHFEEALAHVLKAEGGYLESASEHGGGALLIECKFNPHTDLKHDVQGLLQLETHTARQIKLRDRIRLHMSSRNEDSVPYRVAPNFKEYGK